MEAYSIIPIGFIIASAWWLWSRGAKAGSRVPAKIALAILGAALLIFGNYGVIEFLHANYPRQLRYYLAAYPDEYTKIVVLCITFALVLAVGWILEKLLGGHRKPEA